MSVLITTTGFAEFDSKPLDLLRRAGIRFSLNPFKRKLTEGELLELVLQKKATALLAGTETISAKVFDTAPQLRIISRVGVGLDNVDLEAARRKKVRVFKANNGLTDSVAELTLGMMLDCLRSVSLQDKNIRQNRWEKQMGSLLQGKTVGILGFGKIGKRVAELLLAFRARIIFSDIQNKSFKKSEGVSLKELLQRSDILSIHVASAKTILEKKEITQMKKGAIVINTSRGGVIDEAALYAALRSGKLAAAGLDVFEEEPYHGKLKQLDNVVLTPHIGSYAKESRVLLEVQAVENLIRGLKGKTSL